MSIHFDQRNQRWRFQFDRYIEGKRVRPSRLLPKGWTRAQAEAYDRRQTARLYDLATGAVKPEPLIDEAVLLYLQHHAPSLKSFENIRRELAACADIYTGRPFSALAEIALSYKPVDERGKPLAAATVRNRLAYIRAACRYAWKHHKMGEHNPAERMVMPKVRNARRVYLTRRKVLEVLRHMRPGPERAAVRIAFYSGMRAGELRKCDTMETSAGLVFMLQDTKNGEPRLVPVHTKLLHIVRNAGLWPMPRTRWTVSKAFKAAARAAGHGNARLHDVRHSTASELINAGVDLYTVGGVLGHKSEASTRRYAHLVTGTLAAAVALVGRKPPTPPAKKAA